MGKELNFIEGIEGYLGEPKDCEMLIVLREHGGEEKPAEDFWFHKVVDEEAKNGGKKYFNVLGILAKKIIYSKDEQEALKKIIDSKDGQEALKKIIESKHKQEALKKCAFINLAPFWGGKKCNDNKENTGRFSGEGCVFDMFKNTFKNTALQDKKQIKINKDSNAQDIAKQRLCLIDQAIDSKVKYILTVREIYDAICEKYKFAEFGPIEFMSKGEKRNFKCCKINDTIIYSFYHPSYAGIGYKNLEKIEIPKN